MQQLLSSAATKNIAGSKSTISMLVTNAHAAGL